MSKFKQVEMLVHTSNASGIALRLERVRYVTLPLWTEHVLGYVEFYVRV